VTERPIRQIVTYGTDKRRKGRVRKIALLALLIALLMLLIWSAMYYIANRRLPFPPVDSVVREAVATPEFLYAISGPEGADSLESPVGVTVDDDGNVFAVDAMARTVRSYETDGDYRFSFNAIESDRGTQLQLPQRVTIGPDGNVWVTDRRLRGIFVFSPEDGSFVREFIPASDASETWGPVALSFNEDGVLYVADLGRSQNHRILAFDPTTGTEVARWGTTVPTAQMTQSPGGFYYPNGIAFDAEGNVFVSDMNNHRVQVFTPLGEFKYLIRTSGSPLGLVIDPTQRLYVVDPFAHAVDIYELEGERITGFGGPGLTLGRFRFPSDIVLDATGRIFVSDRENDQVQVWGWPSGIVPPVEIPEEPEQWALCLSPLLLLLIPLLMRRKSFVATADFIDAMIASDAVAEMRNRRYRWLVMREVYAAYTGRESGGVYFDDILKASDYSRTDAEDLMEKTGIDLKTAGVLVLAERTGLLATQDAELAEAAAALGVTVVDREIYLAEYAARGGGATAGRAS
jgi:DNA-binding beta-propeller fold protein YncE